MNNHIFIQILLNIHIKFQLIFQKKYKKPFIMLKVYFLHYI